MSNNNNSNTNNDTTIDAQRPWPQAHAARFDTFKKALRVEVCKEAYNGASFDVDRAARISILQAELQSVVLEEAALCDERDNNGVLRQ